MDGCCDGLMRGVCGVYCGWTGVLAELGGVWRVE